MEYEIVEVKKMFKHNKNGMSQKWAHRAETKDGDEKLVINANKEMYSVGDTIEVSTRSKQTKLGRPRK